MPKTFTLRNFQISLSGTQFVIAITLLNILLYHFPLFHFTLSHINKASLGGWLIFLTVLTSLFLVTAIVLFALMLASRRLTKFFVMVMFVGNAVALYFIVTYQVILDRSMMGNVFNTNTQEAADLFHPTLLLYVLLLGLLPAWIVSRIQIEKTGRIRLLSHAAVIFLTGVTVMYLNAGRWLWLDEHSKRIGGMAMPWSYTINAIRHQMKESQKAKRLLKLPDAIFTSDSKMLVVLVIGESARAQNFSLYGYAKQTNPRLEKESVIALGPVRATATYTTASVHSMLSSRGADSDDYEPLPSYLHRHGVDVIWRTNNWGEPRIDVDTYQRDSDLRERCEGRGCAYDEVLLTNLKERITTSERKKIFVVLHTSGSHGPTYYKKYPKAFEHFTPVCRSVDLKSCTRNSLLNSYDNTILYTDYFLSRTIALLKSLKDTPSMMLYISDHGESLGEHGLYLHGTPFALAPDEQKMIPFIVWRSPTFERRTGASSVKTRSTYGFKNVFHTVIGAFDMQSSIYDKELDLFSKE